MTHVLRTSFITLLALASPLARADAKNHIAPAAGSTQVSLTLSPGILDPTGDAQVTSLTFTPSRFHLVDEKPACIVKEPAYRTKPRYGAFRIGNGPRSVTCFVVDEPAGQIGKLYVDLNQNGDLTDDGPTDWKTLVDGQKRPNYNTTLTVRASWGDALRETETGEYRLLIAHKPGDDIGGYGRVTGRIGTVTLHDKTYPVILAESSNDGLYTVPADHDLTREPVSLYVDLNNDRPFESATTRPADEQPRETTRINLAHPFEIAGHWYVARPTISGATLTFFETTAPTTVTATQPAAAILATIPAGSIAPDFTVEKPDGTPLKLSDFKGKVVILDFWATWCGPCQAAMPGLEKLYQTIKGQDVVVLSINVLDKKSPFDAWMKINAGTNYHFTFGFDPAGDSDDSVATSKFKVFAIPRVFVISRDGKVAASITGSPDNHELRKILESQNIHANIE